MFRKIANAQPFHKALHTGRIRPGRFERTTPEDAQGGRCRSKSVADKAHYRHATQVGYAFIIYFNVRFFHTYRYVDVWIFTTKIPIWVENNKSFLFFNSYLIFFEFLFRFVI